MNNEIDFNPSRPYRRAEIDDAFNKRKALMQKEALQRGLAYDNKNIAFYYDCYTGKTLRGGDRYDYEHIISAEEIFMHFRATHTNNEIAEIVNRADNVAVTLRTINQYKGKYPLKARILDNMAKIIEFEIDIPTSENSLKKAIRAVYNK